LTGEKVAHSNKIEARTGIGPGDQNPKQITPVSMASGHLVHARRKPRVIDLVGDRTQSPQANQPPPTQPFPQTTPPMAMPAPVARATPPIPTPNVQPQTNRPKTPQPITLKAAHPPIAKPKASANGKACNPEQQSMVLAETMVDSLIGGLKTEALKKGGQLSMQDIDHLHNRFRKQTVALSQIFSQSFEAYVRARERANWEQKRDYPFDRILVKNFSHLFNNGTASDFNRVSRRMLPGFFMSIGMMLGPDVVEEFQETCRQEVERVRQAKPDEFVWEDVYATAGAQTISFDAMIAIIQHFADFEKRRQWFSDLINGHLTPVDGANKKDAGWEMTPGGVKLFLRTFFHDLFEALADTATKRSLVKRHGAGACDIALYVQEKVKI